MKPIRWVLFVVALFLIVLVITILISLFRIDYVLQETRKNTQEFKALGIALEHTLERAKTVLVVFESELRRNELLSSWQDLDQEQSAEDTETDK